MLIQGFRYRYSSVASTRDFIATYWPNSTFTTVPSGGLQAQSRHRD